MKKNDRPPLKLKLKFNAGDGSAKIIRPAPKVPTKTAKPPAASKVTKATKKAGEFKSVRLIQEVALASEPVYGGVADAVKTRKRRCQNGGVGFYSECQERVDELPRKKRVKRKAAEPSGRPEKKKQLGPSSGQVEETGSAKLANISEEICDLEILELEKTLAQEADHMDSECLDTMVDAIIKILAERNKETVEDTLNKCLPVTSFDVMEQVPIEPVFGKFKLFHYYL